MTLYQPYNRGLGGFLGGLKLPKRKVFISYHHAGDQYLCDAFSSYFSDSLDLFYDNSVERAIDSDDADYLNRTIREDHIFGTSITIVLCGAETWKRRWIDWEIHATLWHQHALLGIACPSCTKSVENKFVVPSRLHENITSGYANFVLWTQDPTAMTNAIELAIKNSAEKTLIRNSAVKMRRSLS